MTQEKELLPCPFCGGAPELQEDELGAWVECAECGSGPSSWSDDDAVAKWNTRQASTRLRDMERALDWMELRKSELEGDRRNFDFLSTAETIELGIIRRVLAALTANRESSNV